MQQARWIVVGTDFSEGAQCALEQAIRIAGTSGAQIALVHAYEDELESPSVDEDVTSMLRARLAEAIAIATAKDSGVRVEPFIRRGVPWEKLSNVAVEVGADLIIVGAVGQRGGSSSAPLLGSVAHHVLAWATRSVLVSRRPWTQAA